MPGFGTGAIIPKLNNIAVAAQNAANGVSSAVQAPSNGVDLLTSIDASLKALVKSLAPQQRYSEIPFSGLAVGSVLNNQTITLNQGTYNAIIATVVGNGAQVNFYLTSADPNSQPPDFTFVSGYPSSILFFPIKEIGGITLASVGQNAASGKIILMEY